MNSKKELKKKPKRAYTGRQYLIVSGVFVFAFVSLIGYLVYFNIRLRDDYENNPYNRRTSSYVENIVRGKIIGGGGEILAQTTVDEEGNETREYPYDVLFAHPVGYSTRGRGGLEASENKTLTTSHANAIEKVQNEYNSEKNIGDNIMTSLNVNLQQVANDALGDYNGAVIVMDAASGSILADVSNPGFNPNTIDGDWEALNSDSAGSPLLNRALQGLYPPGSTFKIVTALEYLKQHGTIDDFSYDCSGALTVNDFTINCSGGEAHGAQNFREAFANSCNCAFARIGLDLDKTAFAATADKLMLDKRLDLELPTSAGNFDMDANTFSSLVMQTSFGQGDTLVTPMHMALIADAVANGGNAMTPHFIQRIENYTGKTVKETEPSVYANMMTADEASTLKELMKGVVTDGTARKLSELDIPIAGKTGTADHGDLSEPAHSWFVGFSDTGKNDIVVCVLAEKGGYSTDVAVPAAYQIFKSYFGL